MTKFTNEPPKPTMYILDIPAPHVLLITINRPKAMNSIHSVGHWEAAEIFDWFENEPELRVAVITGAGDKAFSAGQDLIEAGVTRTGENKTQAMKESLHPPGGFMAISRRASKKPIIAAVNGYALGGGFEICLGW